MPDFIQYFMSADFMPHGHCYLWEPEILWLHTVSDALTALAYYSIPAALFIFARKRTDFNFRWIFLLFGIFILACGTTHVFGILTTWQPYYRLEGVVKLGTALTSIVTAVVLWPLIPRALRLPSPAQLEASNRALQEEIENRVHAEEEVRRLNVGLEERVRQRTAELEEANAHLSAEIAERHAAEERLRRTAEELTASNTELERFAYVASHDLRAPLHGIENLAIWLEEDLAGVLDAPSREKLTILKGRVGRMESLLDGLLQYSRVGRLKAETETVDLGELIEETVDLLSPPPGFRITIEGDRPSFETLRVPLQQVVRNLIDNAVKHHDRDDGRIDVTVRSAEEGYEISVADDGPGIPAEFHERIFEIFETLRPRDEVEASGVGLAIVKKVAESVGGTVRIESSEGHGATFRLRWPRSLDTAQRGFQQGSASTAAASDSAEE